MGLRLLAHFYERNEALIAAGALEAAGVAVFVENVSQLTVQPFKEIALGGYRLMTPEEGLETALAIFDEARRNPLMEGERLTQRTYILLSLLMMAMFGVVALLRTSKWHDDADGAGARAESRV